MRMCIVSLRPINLCGQRKSNLHELLGDTSSASGLQGCYPHGQSYLVSKGKEMVDQLNSSHNVHSVFRQH